MHDVVKPIICSEGQGASLQALSSLAETNHGSGPMKTGGEGFNLNPLEKQILTLTMAGYSLQERAGLLGMRQHALRIHLLKICDRLGVEGEFELILFALYHKLLDAWEISPPRASKLPVNV